MTEETILKTKYLGMRIDADLKEQLEKLAHKEERSVSRTACLIFRKYFEKTNNK